MHMQVSLINELKRKRDELESALASITAVHETASNTTHSHTAGDNSSDIDGTTSTTHYSVATLKEKIRTLTTDKSKLRSQVHTTMHSICTA
jgi:hypothetical protein